MQTKKAINPIQVLPSGVVDQIAAGEVVERPANMVKELIENSLDAGATEIELDFSQGGRCLVLSDNGHGIPKQEMALAFARHATSKINSSSDIWNLHSFGFRGEALASIGAVAKVKLVSCIDDGTPHAVECHFGDIGKAQVSGGQPGTQIHISELFSNVPARLKFLKSDAAEGTQIKNVVKALALSNPQVSFRVKQKGELLFYWGSSESQLSRVEEVLSLNPMYYGEGTCENIRARVCISAPNQTQRTSKNMWIFVQNRWVQDRTLQAATMDAYRSLLMHGEFPLASIWVDCAEDEVDVNIHPAKSQVKFLNSSNAFRAVHRAVKAILEEAPWLEGFRQEKVKNVEVEETNLKFDKDAVLDRVQFASKSPIENGVLKFNEKISVEGGPFNNDEIQFRETSSELNTKIGFWSRMEVVGQVGLTYLVCQTENGMVLIDQHAAHERVAYERIMQGWKNGNLDQQGLLVPLTLQLDPEEVEAVDKIKDELLSLGLEVEASGPESLMVRSIPSIAKEKAIIKCLQVLAHELVEKGGSFALEKVMSHLAATMACHSVVRAGQALNHEQMRGMLEQMDEFPESSFCPHGRPVYIEFSMKSLEKEFGRIV